MATRSIVHGLGWCVAKLDIDEMSGQVELLTIVSPADVGEHVYWPAESTRIYGRDNILSLKRWLCDNVTDEPSCNGGL